MIKLLLNVCGIVTLSILAVVLFYILIAIIICAIKRINQEIKK